MQRKKGESAARPAIFHTDIYNPYANQQEYTEDKRDLAYARTESRLFQLLRPQKRDTNK